MPLVVHYRAHLQSVHGLRCHGNITRTLFTSLRPSRDMTRGLCALLAGDWPSTWGVLNITAAAWTAGFHAGNITRTQNVSEYILVLALCLVPFVDARAGGRLKLCDPSLTRAINDGFVVSRSQQTRYGNTLFTLHTSIDGMS